MGLLLTQDQKTLLDQLALQQLEGSAGESFGWFHLSHDLLPKVVIEIDTRLIQVQVWSIIVPGLPALMLKPGNTLARFDAKSGRIFLVRGDEGWAVEVWTEYPAPKRGRKPEEAKHKKETKKGGSKGKRIHNEAAIFVTDETRHRVWSGGLPSLGKRR